MKKGMSLRARLILSFSGIIIGTLAAAAIFGVLRFDAMMTEQAQRSVDTSISVASGLLSDEIAAVQESVTGTAADDRLPDGQGDTRVALTNELARRAELTNMSYFAVVGRDGTVRLTSLGTNPFGTTWPLLQTSASAGTGMLGLAVIPASELEAVRLANRLRLTVKETPNGTVVEGEEDGALAIVSAVPFHGDLLVGVRILKLRHDLVDSVVAKVGGTATVFQGGVRISTTVRNEADERALGTVVSDAVREHTLEGGKTYRGDAFVVSKNYLTAYEPLRDLSGAVIGMLYVGVDEAPYAAATRAFAITFGAVMLAALGFGLFGAFTVSRGLSRPLAEVGAAADVVATGDLTATLPTVGYAEIRELGSAFNTMTTGLRSIIGQVEESVMQLRSVSGEITAASRSSAEQATHQASAVAQTTATLEELSRSFQSVADGARRVLDVAEDALESAQSGVHAVDQSHGAMDELSAGADEMATAAGAMTTVADNITEMTSLITGIAEQTKILALNAAIEAARAGEAGKGFAVVSSEIRALADSVAQSASRITELVAGIQAASARLQTSAQQQSRLTDATVSASAESRRTFGLIVQQMEDTAFAAREITEAAAQQQRASHQLVDAMHEVSVSSRESAAAAKQLADSANAVEGEAESLMRGLTRFRTH